MGHQEDVPEPRLVQRVGLPHDGHPDADVHAAVRDRAHHRLERARDRAARGRQDHPPERELRRARKIARTCRSRSADRRARRNEKGRAMRGLFFMRVACRLQSAPCRRPDPCACARRNRAGCRGRTGRPSPRAPSAARRTGRGRRSSACRSIQSLPASCLSSALEQRAQVLARLSCALLDQRRVAEPIRAAEEHLEERMHVGVDQRQPAIHFRARLRRAVAAELRFGMQVGEVIQDRDVLGEDPAIVTSSAGTAPAGLIARYSRR